MWLSCQSSRTTWSKEDFAKLKEIPHDLIPLIRFTSISSVDFCYKIVPYKQIFPKDIFK